MKHKFIFFIQLSTILILTHCGGGTIGTSETTGLKSIKGKLFIDEEKNTVSTPMEVEDNAGNQILASETDLTGKFEMQISPRIAYRLNFNMLSSAPKVALKSAFSGSSMIYSEITLTGTGAKTEQLEIATSISANCKKNYDLGLKIVQTAQLLGESCELIIKPRKNGAIPKSNDTAVSLEKFSCNGEQTKIASVNNQQKGAINIPLTDLSLAESCESYKVIVTDQTNSDLRIEIPIDLQ
jgi:hypothetical protein